MCVVAARPRIHAACMQVCEQPVEVHATSVPSAEQQYQAQLVLAEMLVARNLPIAAETALSAPIPKDQFGNITDGPEDARASCTAWYQAHSATDLMKCASAAGCPDVQTFLGQVADVVQRRNNVALPTGDEWLSLQTRLEGLEEAMPGLLQRAGNDTDRRMFLARGTLSQVPRLT